MEARESNTAQGAGERYICEWVFSRTELTEASVLVTYIRSPCLFGKAFVIFVY